MPSIFETLDMRGAMSCPVEKATSLGSQAAKVPWTSAAKPGSPDVAVGDPSPPFGVIPR